MTLSETRKTKLLSQIGFELVGIMYVDLTTAERNIFEKMKDAGWLQLDKNKEVAWGDKKE